MTPLIACTLVAVFLAILLTLVALEWLLFPAIEETRLALQMQAQDPSLPRPLARALAGAFMRDCLPYLLLGAITCWGLFGFLLGLVRGG